MCFLKCEKVPITASNKNILYETRFKEVILLEYIILLSLDMVDAYPIWITTKIANMKKNE